MSTPVWCAPSAGGSGYTLCGYALEGNPGIRDNAGDPPPQLVAHGQKVTCPNCAAIIKHCQQNFHDGYLAAAMRVRL